MRAYPETIGTPARARWHSIRARFLFAFIFIFVPFLASAGFGVSPGAIEETHLVPGARLERTIYLVQGDPKENLPATLSVESRDIADWISFPNGGEFVIPAGVQQFPLPVTIQVPNDVELGEYVAYIRVATVPRVDPDNQITIALGGRIDVRLVVGDDVIVDFDISEIDILDVKESEDPEVRLTIENKGNTPAGPERVSFELYNKYGDVRLGYAEAVNVDRVPAFSRQDVVVAFPIDIRLAPGEYWAHVRAYGQDGVMREMKTVFDVLPKTFFEKYALILGIALGALTILGVMLLIRRRARARGFRT